MWPLFSLAVLCFVALFVALLSTYMEILPAVMSLPVFISSAKSQVMLLVFFGIMLPVIIIYNAFQYRFFQGKVDDGGTEKY